MGINKQSGGAAFAILGFVGVMCLGRAASADAPRIPRPSVRKYDDIIRPSQVTDDDTSVPFPDDAPGQQSPLKFTVGFRGIIPGIIATPAYQLLTKMLQAQTTLTIAGTEVTTISRATSELSSTEHVVYDGLQGTRIDYLAPRKLAGEQVIDDGRLFQHYHPLTNILETGPSRLARKPEQIRKVLEMVARGLLSVTIEGQEAVAGHQCTILVVGPAPGANSPLRRFWVDPANGAELKIEQFSATRDRHSITCYTDVDYYPRIMPDTFAPIKPGPSTRLVTAPTKVQPTNLAAAQSNADFQIMQPSFLPEGYASLGAFTTRFRGRPMIELRYNNGLSYLSLYETNAGDAVPAGPLQHPRPGVVVQRRSNLTLVLVGAAPQCDLDRVMSSLH